MINADDNRKILNQKEVFNLETGNVKNFIVTFITVNGVKNNMYRDVAQKVLTIDDLSVSKYIYNSLGETSKKVKKIYMQSYLRYFYMLVCDVKYECIISEIML